MYLRPDLDVYFVIPVDHHRQVLNEFIGTLFPDISIKNRDAFFDKTKVIYTGVSLSNIDDSVISLVGVGSYPEIVIPLIFPSSQGWKKHSGRTKTYQRGNITVSFLSKSVFIAEIGYNTLNTIQDSARGAKENSTLPPEFLSLISTFDHETRIVLYSSDASFLVDKLLEVEIEGTRGISGGLFMGTEDQKLYTISGYLDFVNSHQIRSMAALIKLLLNIGTNSEGNRLHLNSFSVTKEDLAVLIKNLYFIPR